MGKSSIHLGGIYLLSWLINIENVAIEASSLVCAHMRGLNKKCIAPFLADDWVPQSAAKLFAARVFCTSAVPVPSISLLSVHQHHQSPVCRTTHACKAHEQECAWPDTAWMDWPWMQEEDTTEICGEGNPKLSYLSFWLQLSTCELHSSILGRKGCCW